MNAAELMIKCLENEKVKYIFGVPGEENEDFLFAIEDSDIIFVPVRHEQGGAFMADVWGRLSGKAGVCLSTLGPGATNLITGIADANLDKAPLVAITGQGDLTRLHHESHQIIDVVKMLEPVTKYNTTINSIDVVPEIVRKAFKIAEAEKPGATHIELPEDIAGLEVEKRLVPLKRTKVRRPSPNNIALDATIALIEKANRPLILAGNGAIRNRSSKALLKFSKKYNIPVVSTFMGKGAISDRERTSLGAVGLGFKDYVIEAFDKSDLVISIGYDIAEYDPENWNTDNDKKIIHIDFDPAEVHTHYVPEVELIGDLADSIHGMTDRIVRDAYEDWFIPCRDNIFESIESYTLADDATEYNTPGVINVVREILPDSGLVISDVGSHKMWIARNFKTYVPNGCIISNGLATMGISLPGGIAAKLLDSDRPVVCIMGDGGAMMNIQELETAKRLGIGCIFIVLNDNNYGLIEWKQNMSEGKSYGTKLGNPNFVKLAESFDIKGYEPKSVSDLKNILGNAIKTNELCLIEIPITTEVNDQLTEELVDYFDYS
jgi:acetolactate synthase-1/2/3 large subunit